MTGRPVVYYFLGLRDGRPAIKIGASLAPMRRLRQVRGAHRILAWHPGGFQAELALHRRFAADALGHEWFRPSVLLLVHIGTFADGSDPPSGRRTEIWCEACAEGREHLCF